MEHWNFLFLLFLLRTQVHFITFSTLHWELIIKKTPTPNSLTEMCCICSEVVFLCVQSFIENLNRFQAVLCKNRVNRLFFFPSFRTWMPQINHFPPVEYTAVWFASSSLKSRVLFCRQEASTWLGCASSCCYETTFTLIVLSVHIYWAAFFLISKNKGIHNNS